MLLDLLVSLLLQKARASCKVKHVPPSWWASHCVPGLNSAHQPHTASWPHSQLAAHLRSESPPDVAQTQLLSGVTCILAFRQGLQGGQAVHLRAIFWAALSHAGTPLKGGVGATGTRGLGRAHGQRRCGRGSAATGRFTQPHRGLRVARYQLRLRSAPTSSTGAHRPAGTWSPPDSPALDALL